MTWHSGLLSWVDNDTAYISVVFSWQLQKAYQQAIWYRSLGYHVRAGGPAVAFNPQYLRGVAEIGDDVPAIEKHNPDATYTSRGCIRHCPFCIVHRIEPEYIELDDWPVRPVVCDNNILAASNRHFNSVIDKLKPLHDVDFNQGLDVRLMTHERANRIAELDMLFVRLAWDNVNLENVFMSAFEMLLRAGIPARKMRAYVLIGYNDTPESALYRLEKIRSLGTRPNPMRYQPLDSQIRNAYVAPGWTERQLRDYMKYWSRLRWYEHIPFNDWVQNSLHYPIKMGE